LEGRVRDRAQVRPSEYGVSVPCKTLVEPVPSRSRHDQQDRGQSSPSAEPSGGMHDRLEVLMCDTLVDEQPTGGIGRLEPVMTQQGGSERGLDRADAHRSAPVEAMDQARTPTA